MEDLLETKLPSMTEKIDLLLKIVAQEAGDNRSKMVPCNFVAWGSMIGAVDEKEVGYILEAACEKGWITYHRVTETLQVNLKGWERMETFERRQESNINIASVSQYNSRPKPAWVASLQDQALRNVLDEVYDAISQGFLMLPLIGARTAFDRAMFLLVQDPKGGFGGKLDAMKASGRIDDRIIRTLHPMIDAGNAAAHRGWSPTAQVLSDVMDEVEHVLWDWFIREDAAAAVRAATPRRA